MTRRARLAVFLVAAAGFAVCWVLALAGAPPVGGDAHPYRDTAAAVAFARATSNAVSVVNYDLRAMDTFGEETILLASVIATIALLRPTDDESERTPATEMRVLPTIRLLGLLLLPVIVLVGLDVIAHGHLTPGGGFQGGAVLAGGVHLLYLAGSYAALQRLRPQAWAPRVEAAAGVALVVVGLVGLAAGPGFLANVLRTGSLGAFASSGTVLAVNVVIGVAVGAGLVVLLAQFLRQELVVVEDR
jgi:multicomponent Na+:H+ antiporter subunit B